MSIEQELSTLEIEESLVCQLRHIDCMRTVEFVADYAAPKLPRPILSRLGVNQSRISDGGKFRTFVQILFTGVDSVDSQHGVTPGREYWEALCDECGKMQNVCIGFDVEKTSDGFCASIEISRDRIFSFQFQDIAIAVRIGKPVRVRNRDEWEYFEPGTNAIIGICRPFESM